MTWRGDEIEVKTLQMLARLYARRGALQRGLAAAHDGDAAAAEFRGLARRRTKRRRCSRSFSSAGKGDALPPIDALACSTIFANLTPIGRRGDEMIRRLADRLVSVDLLDQAERIAAIPDRPPP